MVEAKKSGDRGGGDLKSGRGYSRSNGPWELLESGVRLVIRIRLLGL